jgi:hypothetical protein
MSEVMASYRRHMQERVLAAAKRVAERWGSSFPAEYLAEVYSAVAAELEAERPTSARPRPTADPAGPTSSP